MKYPLFLALALALSACADNGPVRPKPRPDFAAMARQHKTNPGPVSRELNMVSDGKNSSDSGFNP